MIDFLKSRDFGLLLIGAQIILLLITLLNGHVVVSLIQLAPIYLTWRVACK